MKKPGSAPQKRRTVHLVSHTHWDREWYHRASVFRQRLVALIDDLRGAARLDPALHFLLDGQTVLLDDYVAVRPNKQTQLHELLRAGVLEAGPWYVLGDELIPEGEVMVRNLLEGRRMLREYGARPTRVLYCPDSFGHPAVLPLIAREFGCTLIVLWRGFGGTDHPKSSVVRWFAPDGTPAVVYHLPPDGYEFGSSLPPDRTKADARWASVKSDLDARDKFGVALLLNGADHHFLQPDYREALSALQGSAQASQVPSSDFADNIRHSSLNGFARALHHKLLGKIVPAVRGELRDSYGYTWCLQGTFASRAYQKRDFALTTRYLLRNCEPWMALAHFRGATSAQSLLRAAWKTLLLCAPHDSICGCSIDAVAREVDLRLADTQAQAEKLQLAALHHLSGYSAAEVRSAPSQGKDYVVIANPSARRRSGVAEVVLTRKVRDIRVGPGSAAQPAPVPVPELPASLVSAGFELSARVPVVELESARAVQLLESPLHYPDADEVINQHLLTWIPGIDGYSTVPFLPSSESTRNPRLPNPVRLTARSISNGLVSVGWDKDGRIWMRAGDVDNSAEGSGSPPAYLHFEVAEDRGDLYTPSVGHPEQAVTAGAPTLKSHAPLRGVLRAGYGFSTSVDNSGDRRIVMHGAGAAAGGAFVDLSTQEHIALVAELSIDAGSTFVRIVLRGSNRMKHIRLRAVISRDITATKVHADSPLSVVTRDLPPKVVSSGGAEQKPATDPLHRFVSVSDSTTAMSLLCDGLREYEASANGSVAVTLLRSVDQLSRHDLPERPGNAGWPAPVPDALCLGVFEARIGWMAHATSSWNEIWAELNPALDSFLNPLFGYTLRSATPAPIQSRGIQLDGPGLDFVSAKVAENGKGVILRCANLSKKKVTGYWSLPWLVGAARRCRLDEKTVGPLRVLTGNRVRFRARAGEIVSVFVRPKAKRADVRRGQRGS